MEAEKPRFGNIKDELFLISFIILAGGLIFTDAYFQVFGVKFQTLDFNTMYVIYKGLVMILDYPSMLLPYLLTIVILLLEIIAIKRKWRRFLAYRTPFAYIFLLLMLVVIFPLARRAGTLQANRDMVGSSSTLPVIAQLETKSETVPPMGRFRLLLVDKDFLYVFAPTDNPQSSPPIIDRIPKNDVIKFKTQIK